MQIHQCNANCIALQCGEVVCSRVEGEEEHHRVGGVGVDRARRHGRVVIVRLVPGHHEVTFLQMAIIMAKPSLETDVGT